MAEIDEQLLEAVAKRWEAGRRRFDALTEERDDAIRAGIRAGFPYRRLAAVFNLTFTRIGQIKRRSRV